MTVASGASPGALAKGEAGGVRSTAWEEGAACDRRDHSEARGICRHPGSQAAPLLFLALLPGSQLQLPTLSSGLGWVHEPGRLSNGGGKEEVGMHWRKTCREIESLSPERGPWLCSPLQGRRGVGSHRRAWKQGLGSLFICSSALPPPPRLRSLPVHHGSSVPSPM